MVLEQKAGQVDSAGSFIEVVMEEAAARKARTAAAAAGKEGERRCKVLMKTGK